MSVDDSPSLEPQTLTVGAWIKASQSPGTYRYLIAKGSQDCVAASYGADDRLQRRAPVLRLERHRQLVLGFHDASIYDGKWHHVAGTFDGTLAKLFVDGKLIGEGSSVPGTIEYNGPDGNATHRRLPRQLRPDVRGRHRRGAHLVRGAPGRRDLEEVGLALGPRTGSRGTEGGYAPPRFRGGAYDQRYWTH